MSPTKQNIFKDKILNNGADLICKWFALNHINPKLNFHRRIF